MAQNYPKSKLKRKKFSVKELKSETTDRGTAKENDLTFFHSTGTGNSEGPALPAAAAAAAAAWWNRPQPPAVDSLWASTLKSALPYLEKQHWDPAPDLPLPSAAKPSSLKPDDPRWCDLCSEVGPLPESSPPSLPSPRTSSSLGSSQQDLLIQTKPAAEPPDSPDHQTDSPPVFFSKTQRPSVHRWEEEEEGASSSSAAAGQSSVGGEAGRKRGERKEAGPVSRQLHSQGVKACDRSAPPGEQEEVQRSSRGDERARLQSCPMCLQVFPAGFTQMDCDGHLAQCLSEMNVDVTW